MIDACDLLLKRFSSSARDTLLVDTAGNRFTYELVWSHAHRLAEAWSGEGAEPGDCVALLLDNGPYFLCAYLACFIGGFVAAPVNRHLPPGDIDYILSLARPRITVREAEELAPDIEARPVSAMRTSPEDVAVLFFTSGTTGRPKGVRHTLNALAGNVHAFNRQMGLGPETRMYHVLPMAYMAGFLNTMLSPMVAGGQIVLGPRFSPQSALTFWSTEKHGAQTIWLTPSIAAALQRMTRDAEAARGRIAEFRQIFCGTAPLHDAIRSSFMETFAAPLQESYGTSELLLIAAQTREDAGTYTDVGSLLEGLDIAFRPDDDGNPEIAVSSPFACKGYLTDRGVVPLETFRTRFFPTGDAGHVQDGRLVISSRLKDLIIRGGVNISPVALENVLGDIEGVGEIAVVGVPHPFWGESIVVCIEAADGADRETLRAEVKAAGSQRLAPGHQPDLVELVDAFPRTDTGKVQKNILRDLFSS